MQLVLPSAVLATVSLCTFIYILICKAEFAKKSVLMIVIYFTVLTGIYFINIFKVHLYKRFFIPESYSQLIKH